MFLLSIFYRQNLYQTLCKILFFCPNYVHKYSEEYKRKIFKFVYIYFEIKQTYIYIYIYIYTYIKHN